MCHDSYLNLGHHCLDNLVCLVFLCLFRERLGIQLHLREKHLWDAYTGVLSGLCWPCKSMFHSNRMVFLCLQTAFFHWTLLLPALEIQGLREKQRQDTGQHWQLPAAAVTAGLGDLWDEFSLHWWMLCTAAFELYQIPLLTFASSAGTGCYVYESDSQTHQKHNLPADLWDHLPCFSGNLTAAETALISRKARSEDLTLPWGTPAWEVWWYFPQVY